jgi:molybdopterin-guanine dinucleotide biosynthesis protein MobB
MHPPLLAIVGKKHAGKTTLTVRLSAELKRRGHRVMTIKHGTHTFNLDPSTTDTYRHYHEGGAERVAMISPDKFALIMRRNDADRELTPELIAERYLDEAGIVLCEGFKVSELPKVEIFRRAAHEAPLYDPALPNAASWRAMVTDTAVDELPFPRFDLSDDRWLDRLASWVEEHIISIRA